MGYTVVISNKALKELSKMDKPTQKLLLHYIETKLDGCINPRVYGKALQANHMGKWSYRVGNYRLLALIQDEILTIQVLKSGHRSVIYED